MKSALWLVMLTASAVWADEAADRAAVESTISALNAPTLSPGIFTADFPNAADLKRLREEARLPELIRQPAEGTIITTPAGTVVISREPMGEATWFPSPQSSIPLRPGFVTRSVAFVAPDTAVVVAAYARQTVLLVLKREAADWKIASLRIIPEAQSQIL